MTAITLGAHNLQQQGWLNATIFTDTEDTVDAQFLRN